MRALKIVLAGVFLFLSGCATTAMPRHGEVFSVSPPTNTVGCESVAGKYEYVGGLLSESKPSVGLLSFLGRMDFPELDRFEIEIGSSSSVASLLVLRGNELVRKFPFQVVCTDGALVEDYSLKGVKGAVIGERRWRNVYSRSESGDLRVTRFLSGEVLVSLVMPKKLQGVGAAEFKAIK